MFAGGEQRGIVSTADAARKPFTVFAEPNDSTAGEPLLCFEVCPMSVCTGCSVLNGSVAVAMHWRGKGSKFRLRELRKQEADMHKSMGRVLSLSRLLASGVPVLAHTCTRRGAPQLGVNTATRAFK